MEKQRQVYSIRKAGEFEKVFREFFVPLTHFSMKVTRDMDTSKEIVHKVFISLWEKRNELHRDVPIRSYLFTAVRNRSLNYLRDQSKFVKEDISEVHGIEEQLSEDSAYIEESETEARILREIANLPERCAEIFRLARFENKKYREIAEALNISVKTVEAQMSKALRILRENLSDIIGWFILWIFYIYNCFL